MVPVRRYFFLSNVTMNNLLKTAGKAIGYLGGGLTLITFAQGVKSNNQNKIIIESLKKKNRITRRFNI